LLEALRTCARRRRIAQAVNDGALAVIWFAGLRHVGLGRISGSATPTGFL